MFVQASEDSRSSTSFDGDIRGLRYSWVKPSLAEAMPVVALALCKEDSPELREDVRQHLESAEFGVSVWHDTKLVGFMLFTLPLKNVLYIAGTMIDPVFQGAGIKAFVTRLTMTVFPQIELISGRTQSPIVWSSVAKISRQMLPHPTHQDPELEALRLQVAKNLGMSSVVERGFYGGPLYGQKPVHHDPTVQSWWDSFINFERGDATLYLARYTHSR